METNGERSTLLESEIKVKKEKCNGNQHSSYNGREKTKKEAEKSKKVETLETVHRNGDEKERKDSRQVSRKILEKQVRERDRTAEVLRRKVKEKQEMIQRLIHEIERRDKIMELSVTPTEGREVTLHLGDDGYRTYEIRNKEQIPFYIKTERLSPKIWERWNDELEEDSLDIDNSLSRARISEEGDPDDHESDDDKSGVKNGENSGLTNGRDETHFAKLENGHKSRKRRISSISSESSSCGVKEKRGRRERGEEGQILEEEQQSPKKEESPVFESSSSASSPKSESVSNLNPNSNIPGQKEEGGGKSVDKIESTMDSPPSSNVLEIPELQRINFGCSELWDLRYCPVAQKFWYDESSNHLEKFFIRLYDDRGNWIAKREFVVKEQIGLGIPTTFQLKFNTLIEILQETPNKRIWLDVRDFNIFSEPALPFFTALSKVITYFSFGSHLYSNDMVRSNMLLEFIFEHLPNLEFLSINDEMVFKLDSLAEPRTKFDRKLEKLRTLRLIHTRFNFCTPFITKILKMAPNIQVLYAIPLHFLGELTDIMNTGENSGQNHHMESPICIRSVFIMRSVYSESVEKSHKFHSDLAILSRIKGRGRLQTALEELDARTFFIFLPTLRVSCVTAMSTLLEENKETLRTLIVERLSPTTTFLEIPVLHKLKLLQFDLGRMTFANDLWSFFPLGFDLQEKFPKLAAVEIHQDVRGWKRTCNISRGTPRLSCKIFEQDFPRTTFKRGGCFPLVQALYLYFFTPPDCISKMQNLFRNLRVLRMFNNFVDVTKVLPKVFQFLDKLQQLTLEMDTDSRWGNLDEAITGIPKEKCKILANALPFPHSEEKILKRISSHRDKPSITKLKDLRLFRIVLRSAYDNSFNRIPIFTPVSAMYGFGENRMPKLHVHVAFEERVSLREKSDMIFAMKCVRPYLDLEV